MNQPRILFSRYGVNTLEGLRTASHQTQPAAVASPTTTLGLETVIRLNNQT
jgi:hypothetical protein